MCDGDGFVGRLPRMPALLAAYAADPLPPLMPITEEIFIMQPEGVND